MAATMSSSNSAEEPLNGAVMYWRNLSDHWRERALHAERMVAFLARAAETAQDQVAEQAVPYGVEPPRVGRRG